MNDEQFERIIAMLERIANMIEAQNKPKEITSVMDYRGHTTYYVGTDGPILPQGTCMACLNGTCKIEGSHT